MLQSGGYEPIVFDDGLPVKLNVRKLDMIRVRWHSHPEMLFVIKGKIRLYMNQTSYYLKAGQMFFIESGLLHTLDPEDEDNLIVGIRIDSSAFRVTGGTRFRFRADRFMDAMKSGEADLAEMNRLMALVVHEYDKRPKGYANQIFGYLNGMLAWLIRYDYLSEQQTVDDPAQNISGRMNSILHYMNEHFQEDLSLQDVADHEHISYYYLSASFKQVTGMTFREHLSQIRLQKSMMELRTTKNSLEMIAAAYGFSSARSYASLFQQHYGCSPTVYRTKYWQKNPGALEENTDANAADYELVYSLMNPPKEELKQPDIWKEERLLEADASISQAEPVRRIWAVTATCSRAADLLRSDIQDLVCRAKEEIGFHYLRFHGIFSDDMMICHRDPSGSLQFNWVYVNQILDFLVGIGMKPFLELSFMPGELASGEQTVFWYKANITPPKDMEDWRNLVHSLIRHCVHRYGAAEVRQWYAEVWSQPDYKDYFWTGSMEDYFHLYKVSAEAIRNACPGMKVGGPGISSVDFENSEWVRSFTSFCTENKVPLDFVSFHVYSDRQEYYRRNRELVPTLTSRAKLARGVESALTGTHIKAAGKAVSHFHITEWNLSARYIFSIRDTVFMAPYVIESILSCMDQVDSMAFWMLSDLLDEIRLKLNAFHGGMGLFSAYGIPKPSYIALRLLNELGDEIISRGDGWIVTRCDDEIQILLWNMAFLDQLASQNTDFSSEYTGDVYALFEEKPHLAYTIKLHHARKKYRMTVCEVNRESGSSYDTWVAMGAQQEIHKDEIEYLKSMSMPRIKVQTVQAEDGILTINTQVPPNGCQLIKLG